MKTFLAFGTIALLTALPFAPAATALHYGPCTHEYFDSVLLVYDDFKDGGFRQALGNLGARLGGCVDGSIWWVCSTSCDLTIETDLLVA